MALKEYEYGSSDCERERGLGQREAGRQPLLILQILGDKSTVSDDGFEKWREEEKGLGGRE